MERLTARNEYGGAYYPYCFREDTCGGDGESEKCVNCEFNIKVCSRLADFEDIGLEPEQLREVDKLYTEKCEELAKYKKLEEQGRLLELPCKEGTPVYMVERDCGGDTIACHYRECETCGDLYHYVEQNAFEAYMRDDIGKTVFLTKEEAEAALKNY